MEKTRGFTLIEISIVLVIIGLIVGGVLVGQDLIKAAQMRATVSQTEKYNAAVNTFQGKYNCLPGDCLNALTFGLGTGGGAGDNGDGNGMIGGPSNYLLVNVIADPESTNFWYHLWQAGLISERVAGFPSFATGIASPKTALPRAKGTLVSGFWIFPPNLINQGMSPARPFGKHAFYIGALSMAPDPSTQWYGNDAFALDSKIDDGYPMTGTVIAISPGFSLVPNLIVAAAAGANPSSGGSGFYCYFNDVSPRVYNTLPDYQYPYCGLTVLSSF